MERNQETRKKSIILRLTEHDPPLTGPNGRDHVETEPVVEAAVLHRDGHDQAADKHHVGPLKIRDSSSFQGSMFVTLR